MPPLEIKCEYSNKCRSYPKKCQGCLKNDNYMPDYFESDKEPKGSSEEL